MDIKQTIRVPLDQYAFVEETMENGTPDEVIGRYRELKREFEVGSGLNQKDWNRVLDNYLWGTKSMEADEYAGMNLFQQSVVQEIKKSRKRQ